MSLTAILIGLALLLIAIPYVGSPLRNKVQPKTSEGRQNEYNFKQNYEVALLTIRDLDFDHQLGMVSEEDYSLLRQQYLVEAAEAYEQKTVVESDLEQLIENAVYNRRHHLGNAQVQCANCGADHNPVDKFCVKCGFQTRNSCPVCNQVVEQGDNFCTSCGTQISAGSGLNI